MNSHIKKLHRQLIQTHKKLDVRLGKTRDRDEGEALLREMEEVNFRVMMAGRLVFKETTDTIDRHIDTVLQATSDIQQAIADLEKVRDIVKQVGKWLGAVDSVLDKVKLRM